MVVFRDSFGNEGTSCALFAYVIGPNENYLHLKPYEGMLLHTLKAVCTEARGSSGYTQPPPPRGGECYRWYSPPPISSIPQTDGGVMCFVQIEMKKVGHSLVAWGSYFVEFTDLECPGQARSGRLSVV